MSEDPLKGLTPLELAAESIESRKIDWATFSAKPIEDFYWSVWRLYFNLMLRDETGRVTRGFLPGTQAGLDGATLTQGVGAGMRLYLRSIVLPLLGVDAAYGVNSGEFRFYVVAGVNPS